MADNFMDNVNKEWAIYGEKKDAREEEWVIYENGVEKIQTLKFDEIQQINKQQNAPGAQENVPVNLPESMGFVVIDEVPEVPAQAPPRAKYIAFSEAYTVAQKKDNDAMKEIRLVLKEYFQRKKDYEDGKENLNDMSAQMLMEKALASLYTLQELCENYKQIALPFFFKSAAIAKKQEVEQLANSIEEELISLNTEYSDFVIREFGFRGGYDDQLKQRVKEAHKDTLQKGDVILVGKDGKLDLEKWNTEATISEYEQKSVKNYMRLKCTADLKKDIFTDADKELIKLILEYTKIENVGANLSGAVKKAERNKMKARQKRESDLYREIIEKIDTLSKDANLSEERKHEFDDYLYMIRHKTEGTLRVSENEEVKDCTNIVNYKLTGFTKGADGTDVPVEQQVKTVDRTRDPLFAHVPCANDVIQGGIGNCFLLSAIASAAADDPDWITSMFKEEGDHVIVRLYHHNMEQDENNPATMVSVGKQPIYIKIDKKVDEELNRGALWVSLLCKAYAVYVQNYGMQSHQNAVNAVLDRMRNTQGANDPALLDYGFIESGGTSQDVLAILTGKLDGTVMDVNKNVYKAKTIMDTIKEDYAQNDKVVFCDAIKDQKSVMFKLSANDNQYYMYHKDSHKGLLPKGEITWGNNVVKFNYFANFSAGARALLEQASYGKPIDEIAEDPAAVEKALQKADYTMVSQSCDACFAALVSNGLAREEEAERKKQLIFQKMKKEAALILKDMCGSAKRLTEAQKSKTEFFTGDYSDEALALFRKIKTYQSRDVLLGASSRETIGKKTKGVRENMGDGVLGSHGYSVIGTQELIYEGKRIYMVRVRNPWGVYSTSYRKNRKTGKVEAVTEKRADGGEFLMELTHFMQTFIGLNSATNSWDRRE